MTLKQVMKELETLGSEQTRKTFRNHGARDPFFGVKVGDLKKILKKTGKDHELAMQLYDTGNSDAMYLAGLMADPRQMTKKDLQKWVKGAYWYMISDYTVAWVASESPHGAEMARKWIRSKQEFIASAGWATLSSYVSIRPDEEIDLEEIQGYLDEIKDTIHDAPNRVRYTMNGFVIAAGCYIKSLTKTAIKIGKSLGKVQVNMGTTSCKVPTAPEYIQKVIDRGSVGKKRKGARC